MREYDADAADSHTLTYLATERDGGEMVVVVG